MPKIYCLLAKHLMSHWTHLNTALLCLQQQQKQLCCSDLTSLSDQNWLPNFFGELINPADSCTLTSSHFRSAWRLSNLCRRIWKTVAWCYNSNHTSFCVLELKHPREITMTQTLLWVMGGLWRIMYYILLIYYTALSCKRFCQKVSHRMTKWGWHVQWPGQPEWTPFCRTVPSCVCCTIKAGLNEAGKQLMEVNDENTQSSCIINQHAVEHANDCYHLCSRSK